MNGLTAYLNEQLCKREEKGNLRACIPPPEDLVDFASNDYLGLNFASILGKLVDQEKMQMIDFRGQWHGSGGSRLLTGNSSYCLELEEEISSFHQEEAGLLFNSGYAANLGLISAVVKSSDTILFESGIHASFHDAIRMSKAKAVPFRHLEMNQLKERLQKARGTVFVCIESVSSTDGMQPDLKMVLDLCQEAGAHLIVDEAHATGCLGSKGQGAVQTLGLQGKVFARVHTFGKALGCQGAIVVGSSLLRNYLINFSRPFIYTTALPLQNLIVIRCAYRAIQAYPVQRRKLKEAIDYFRQKAEGLSLPLSDSATHIQSFFIRGAEAAKRASKTLQEKGFDVRALLSPTVRNGKECLRICLHAFNTAEQIDGLLQVLEEIYGTHHGLRDRD